MAKQGTFHWNELASADVARSKRFYGDLLGWRMHDMEIAGMTYTILMTDEAAPPAGGLFTPPSAGGAAGPDQWMAYVTVDDVDAAAAKVKSLGGTVLQEPFDIEGVGRICMIADPGGARLGLITPSGAM